MDEPAEKCVGCSGADIRAVCTEAALCALRHHYLHSYGTFQRLLLNLSTTITTRLCRGHEEVAQAMESLPLTPLTPPPGSCESRSTSVWRSRRRMCCENVLFLWNAMKHVTLDHFKAFTKLVDKEESRDQTHLNGYCHGFNWVLMNGNQPRAPPDLQPDDCIITIRLNLRHQLQTLKTPPNLTIRRKRCEPRRLWPKPELTGGGELVPRPSELLCVRLKQMGSSVYLGKRRKTAYQQSQPVMLHCYKR
ncbi:hypothetical protein Q8A73_000146 [Channa argus]|nr:hypothetical protein Q8A73_000146 [Channa argus]